MRKTVPFLIFATAVLSTSKVVLADQQLSFFEGGSIPLTQAPADMEISIRGFNPALGTLDAVGLFGTFFATVTVNLSNPATDPEAIFGAYVPNFVATPSGSPWGSAYIEMLGIDGTAVDGGTSKTITDTENDVVLGAGFITSADELGAFVSSGNIFLPVTINTVVLGSTGDLIVNGASTMVSADVQLGYVYTPAPIPEPATGILLITAIMVAGPLRWLRPHRSLGDSTN